MQKETERNGTKMGPRTKKGGRPRVESGCRRERRVERGRRLAEHVLATERDPRRRKRPMPSPRLPPLSPVNLLRASSRFVGSFRVNASPSVFDSPRTAPHRTLSRRTLSRWRTFWSSCKSKTNLRTRKGQTFVGCRKKKWTASPRIRFRT